MQQRHISPAAVRCGLGRSSWHTFRHTFQGLLDETGAPIKVQQELMSHAGIRTTYGLLVRFWLNRQHEQPGEARGGHQASPSMLTQWLVSSTRIGRFESLLHLT